MPAFDPGFVDPTEMLSRYVLDKSQYRISDCSVKFTAFMPPDDLCLSVFRTSGLSESDVWLIGKTVGTERNKTLHGRAEIVTLDVTKNNLDVNPDNNPPHHANVVGWPQEKLRQRLIAQILASRAVFKLPPVQRPNTSAF